jgi:hypothetical protein
MNLFALAEKQLEKEIDIQKRDNYSLGDILDYAIKIRHYLDHGKKFNHKEWRKQYYLKKGV